MLVRVALSRPDATAAMALVILGLLAAFRTPTDIFFTVRTAG
jgi:hypothetical protein